MISNARMYSVSPAVGELWRRLFAGIARRAEVPLSWVAHAEPASISELWRRPDNGAVFICGLPYARSEPRPTIVAAPVPSPVRFQGRAQYWSDLVVRADSGFRTIEDTFGGRIALTTMESQSGCSAALYFLMGVGGARGAAGAATARGGTAESTVVRGALYREVIAPRVTPVGALTAVVDGYADVAPIDSYAFALLQRHSPELTSQVRVVARTVPTAIPPIVASHPVPQSLESAFLEAHKNPSTGALMADLQIERFVSPDPTSYDVLKRRFEVATAFWGEHPFATVVHPAFAGLATGPLI